jgi:hypothetical protein
MTNNYKNKYIKYKQKYLHLKNIINGGSESTKHNLNKLKECEEWEKWNDNDIRLRMKKEVDDKIDENTKASYYKINKSTKTYNETCEENKIDDKIDNEIYDEIDDKIDNEIYDKIDNEPLEVIYCIDCHGTIILNSNIKLNKNINILVHQSFGESLLTTDAYDLRKNINIIDETKYIYNNEFPNCRLSPDIQTDKNHFKSGVYYLNLYNREPLIYINEGDTLEYIINKIICYHLEKGNNNKLIYINCLFCLCCDDNCNIQLNNINKRYKPITGEIIKRPFDTQDNFKCKCTVDDELQYIDKCINENIYTNKKNKLLKLLDNINYKLNNNEYDDIINNEYDDIINNLYNKLNNYNDDYDDYDDT